MTWLLIQESEDYKDYQTSVKDVNDHGVRLTLSQDQYTEAWYLTVQLDNSDGDIFHEKSFPVDSRWAEKVTKEQ